MPGAPDPLYVKAREVLLDALEALLAHRSSPDEAIGHLRALFGTADAPGSGFAARALEALEPEDTIRASCAALSQDLLAEMTRA